MSRKVKVSEVVNSEVVNSEVVNSEVKDMLDSVEKNVKEKNNKVVLGKGKREREVDVNMEKIRNIIEESKGNKSYIIRELYKEFNLRNCDIKDIMEMSGVRVKNIVMVSNVLIKYKEGLKYESVEE